MWGLTVGGTGDEVSREDLRGSNPRCLRASRRDFREGGFTSVVSTSLMSGKGDS